jgi:hypothetical protein
VTRRGSGADRLRNLAAILVVLLAIARPVHAAVSAALRARPATGPISRRSSATRAPRSAVA